MDLVVGDVGQAAPAEAESLYIKHLDATATLAANAAGQLQRYLEQDRE